jgi:hypothetical protein
VSKNTTKKQKTARKPSGKIHYEAGGRNMTSQAGLIAVIKFLDGRGFSGLFHRHVPHERAGNAQYHLVDMIYLVLIGLVGGARRLIQCVALWSDGVVRRMAGDRALRLLLLRHHRAAQPLASPPDLRPAGPPRKPGSRELRDRWGLRTSRSIISWPTPHYSNVLC